MLRATPRLLICAIKPPGESHAPQISAGKMNRKRYRARDWKLSDCSDVGDFILAARPSGAFLCSKSEGTRGSLLSGERAKGMYGGEHACPRAGISDISFTIRRPGTKRPDRVARGTDERPSLGEIRTSSSSNSGCLAFRFLSFGGCVSKILPKNNKSLIDISSSRMSRGEYFRPKCQSNLTAAANRNISGKIDIAGRKRPNRRSKRNFREKFGC